ncbi:phosphate ABC transporter substrate-binding protein PstS family protein [Colwellia sp. E2M01]|uniref:PstS family phosphate ABC transporter substrate-binding protein n=1 Tax=Colwellia sp. E2M01 TaxID=2841561 RepID=UPI001C0A18D2|nr:phosphate ABC transporter substrate-binding protein PstS family protein [Colwellia sp. E2M01]MBU2869390.1 phosphate ABC transporter substrate-binding protein PstS family protein [Colwellia sp. E2M01]
MSIKKVITSIGLSSVISLSSMISSSAFALDENLPEYKKVSGISGNVSSVGSDTLANMMTFWAEDFKRVYPNVNVQIQAAGSSTAPPALTEATSNLGPMSRKMKSREIEAFQKRYGYKPTAVRVAIDALAVFVHKDNPLEGLNIEQVDAIFSINRKCGGAKDIDRWGDLNLTGEWTGKDIQLYGRNSVSGTYGYYKKKALCKGDFKNSVNEQPGSASVVQSVSASLNSIGYSGIGYRTSGVRALPLAKKGDKYIEASTENAVSGDYPLSRYLYVYVNKHPNKPLSPMEAEFIKLMLSKSGQGIVEKDGYIPLPSSVVQKEFKKLGLL